MINLIPNEEKKKKVRDFYLRFLIVCLFVLSFSMFLAFLMLLPSYFISSVKKNFANDQLTTQKTKPTPEINQEILSQIADLDSRLTLIENAGKNKYIVSVEVVNKIVLKKMPDIKINQISYQNSSISGKIIRIYGTAGSRERLLLFRKALEDDTAFKKVDLPISNFVKGSNISFYLSIIPS